jgi:hypothetical protein
MTAPGPIPVGPPPPGSGVEVRDGATPSTLAAGVVTALLAVAIVFALALAGVIAARAAG